MSPKPSDKKDFQFSDSSGYRDLMDSIVQVPDVLPVLPLRDIVIYPYMIFPILVGREQSINAANYSLKNGKYIFLAAQKKSSVEAPDKNDIYKSGTVAKVIQVLKLPNGLMKILVDGLALGRIVKFTDKEEFFEAKVKVIVEEITIDSELNALQRQLVTLFKDYIKINKNLPAETLTAFDSIQEPDRKLFYAAANINQSLEVKQGILEKNTLKEQYFEIVRILNSEIDILRIEKEIDSKVQENISRSQRRFIIQEQIKILQEELGETDSFSSEIDELRKKVEEAAMPETVNAKATEELNKLSKIPPMSPEYTVLRNYVDWLVSIPWSKKSEDKLDINYTQTVLDGDHFGLEKPKARIIEHIAVLNLVKNLRGQILCLVGPPGVGKTSLGKSIARSLGREFVRISLGGVRDEAEIRGHRRTYIGSMPGKIVQAMKRAGTINPVILLDEIDKMSSDFRGDPAAAMLEVLDPEQNGTFNDHYIELDYDLSQVLFITTANVRYNIPLPLQDRMEIIELNGYLETDKIQIAKRHLLPKIVANHGLQEYKVVVTDDAINSVIGNYTREAGVRNLERELSSLMRKTAKEVVAVKLTKGEKSTKKLSFTIDVKKVEELLGIPRYKQHQYDSVPKIGSVTGLAWTSVGGELLTVDVTIMEGGNKLTLTGKLGDVMKESGQAALSYIRTNAELLGLKKDFFKNKEIHIHLPEGAIPKDGPSAGITLTMAMLSALSGKAVRGDIAMTGEITLRGQVLPIGGLTEKLLAAKRNGIKRVLIPKENMVDLSEIKDEVKQGIEIIPVETIEEAIPYVFENKAKKNTGRVTKNSSTQRKK